MIVTKNLNIDLNNQTPLSKEKEIPYDGIPEEIKKLILQTSSFSEIKKLIFLNKSWKYFFEKNEIIIWEKLLDKIKSSSNILYPKSLIDNQNIQNKIIHPDIQSIKKEIRDILFGLSRCFMFSQGKIRDCYCFPDSLIDEIRSQIDNFENIGFQEILELVQTFKAINILFFWDALQKTPKPGAEKKEEQVSEFVKKWFNEQIENWLTDKELTARPPNEEPIEPIDGLFDEPLKLNPNKTQSIKELLDLTKGFKSWCKKHSDKLLQIEVLCLDGRGITSIPGEIVLLKNLHSLILSDNQLFSMTPKITQLEKLTTLNLTYNNLTTLPCEIGTMKNLKIIALSFNPLTSLPEIFNTQQKIDVSSDQKLFEKMKDKSFWIQETPNTNDVLPT